MICCVHSTMRMERWKMSLVLVLLFAYRELFVYWCSLFTTRLHSPWWSLSRRDGVSLLCLHDIHEPVNDPFSLSRFDSVARPCIYVRFGFGVCFVFIIYAYPICSDDHFDDHFSYFFDPVAYVFSLKKLLKSLPSYQPETDTETFKLA